MPVTYTLIASNTLTTSAASVTFSAIPSTFTDLVVRFSARATSGGWNSINLTFNNNTSSVYSRTYLMGDGSVASSLRVSNQTAMSLGTNTVPSQDTAIFSNSEIYISSYLSSANKPVSSFSVGDRNAVEAFILADAGLFRDTAAVSSMTLTSVSSNFVSGSAFFLYGIKNS